MKLSSAHLTTIFTLLVAVSAFPVPISNDAKTGVAGRSAEREILAVRNIETRGPAEAPASDLSGRDVLVDLDPRQNPGHRGSKSSGGRGTKSTMTKTEKANAVFEFADRVVDLAGKAKEKLGSGSRTTSYSEDV